MPRTTKKQYHNWYLSLAVLAGVALIGSGSTAFSENFKLSESVITDSDSDIETTDSVNDSDKRLEARGLIRSASRVKYRSDLVAPVAETPFLEGMAFKKGDLLVGFDCKKHYAEQKVAEARANAAWIDHASKTRLLEHKAIGKDEVAIAEATATEATASIQVFKTKGESCQFKAPFSGRVVELNAHPAELPPTEKPLIVIIKDSVLELEMVVPSHWLNWMAIGHAFEFKIDETKETLSAKIERIGAEVDPVSQTIKIIGVLNKKGTRTLSGMSGNAWFDKPTQ